MGKKKTATPVRPVADDVADDIVNEAPPEYNASTSQKPASDLAPSPGHDLEAGLPPPPEYVRSVGAARWLEINLKIANVTAGIMFVVAIVNLAFAGVVKEDLQDDRDAQACSYYYIAMADRPWVGVNGVGRYESDCRTLLNWSYVATAAGSISMIRAFVSCLPAGKPTFWLVRFSSGSMVDRKIPPSRVYLFRAAVSGIAFALYLAAVVMLATSRAVTGPLGRSNDKSYHEILYVALSVLAVSALVSLHQVFCTTVAAFAFRGTVRRL